MNVTGDIATVLEFKRGSCDDGPGLRTVVFLKGCPLACAWCHNPESRQAGPELAFFGEECVECGACAAACPEGALPGGTGASLDRGRCTLCFKCADACPSGALRQMGRPVTVGEAMEVIERDVPFFRNSGGGVTLTGGEPTLYLEWVSSLLQRCRERGIHTLVETCGAFASEAFEQRLAPWLDAVFFDCKLLDGEAHRRWCGADNARILDNLRRLSPSSGAAPRHVLPRIPLVPGVTDTDENLRGWAGHLAGLGFRHVALLPYNPTWSRKAEALGRKAEFASAGFATAADLARCRAWFAGFERVT